MAKPDVRVRLSAEGVQEVVNSLKRIQAEGQKTATKSKAGFGGLNRTLGFTRSLMGGLGIAIGFVTFKRMISGAIEAADQINKLGAKVGASTENLSALALVARTSDADLNQVGAALIRMNKNLGDAQAGIPTALGHLRDLGLELKDFKGKDSVQTFELISKKLYGLEDQLVRDRVAIGLFGRSGAQLKPTMQALADEGLANVIERARSLGVLFDRDLAAASERIKDDLEILQMQGESFGIHFMAGFGPELSQTLQALSGNIGDTGKAWEQFGQGVGVAMKFVVAVVGSAVDIVTQLMGKLAAAGVSLSKVIYNGMRGNFEAVREEIKTFARFDENESKRFRERMKSRWDLSLGFAPKIEPTEVSTGTAGASAEEIAELADKRAQALVRSLDREIALVKAKAAIKVKEEKRELEAGLQSLTQYYADRRQALEEAHTAELAALKEKEDALGDFLDPARAEEERARIAQQREKSELEHGEKMAALTFEETKAVRDLGQERLDLEAQLLNLQGKRFDAERLGIEAQIAAADELLRKQGESDAQRKAILDELRTSLTADIDFDEARAEAEAALRALGTARADIDAQAGAGLISQLEAETELLALEQTRLETLRQLAAAMLAAAEATGDPEKIAQAQQFADSIDEIAYNVEAAQNVFATLGSTAIDSATSSLAEFFNTGIDKSTTFKSAFSQLATAIIGDLKRIVAQMLASQIMKSFTGLFSGGGQVGADFIGPMPAAGGGLIRGPGTGTSDSILAAVSNDEYITRAWAVRQPGVLEHLRAINKYGSRALAAPEIASLPRARFAEGGLVEGGGGEATVGGKVTLGLDRGLVLEEIRTPRGQRVLIETVSENRRAIRSALGI